MHRLHRDSHIAVRARFRPLNETHYQPRKANPIFFFIEPSRSANESRRNSLALFLFFFLFFFFLHPSRVLRQGCRTIRVSSTFCLLSGSAAFFLECPPPFRYVSRDPQKTSTPRTRNLISFSRLVTATTPRAGILRRLAYQSFVLPERKKGERKRSTRVTFPETTLR